MPKRHLRWHLFPFFAASAFFSALAVGWFAASRFELAGLSVKRGELSRLAAFLDSQQDAEPAASQQGFASLAADFSRTSDVRIALLAPSLAVVFDTSGHPEELEKQSARAEIREALAGATAAEVRYNPALDQRAMYFAAPVMRAGRPVGVLYLSTPLVALDEAVGRLRSQTVILAALTGVLAAALAWWVARGIAAPLEVIRRAADALGAGQWNTRVALPETLELAELADSFNRLADAWQRRVAVLIQNNNELKAVLASMAEGVLAVDSQEHLISMNTSCGRLLSIDPVHAQGRRLREVVRNADLSRFVIRSLACADGVEADVLLHGDRGRVIEAQGSALHDLDGRTIGAVVVLNDVTDFRRLEQIRRDFVANVSHELKTPITSIKGFVETLLDGAIRDPVDSERFLQIVAKQADRLHAIIEDLLSLSKIEQSEDANNLELETTPLRAVLESAVYTCQTAAVDRNITVALDCDPELVANVNSVMLEQAFVNLLDNAIKYSEPGREVRIDATISDDHEIKIRVADRGSGIASEHLSRIFERFYRVDRARSRKLGGTGLGLAIVKHIVQAHHGRIEVDSTLGVGTTFTIHLPRP